MADAAKKVEVRFGAFACTIEGYDDPVAQMREVLGMMQRMISETPALAEAAEFDPDQVKDALKGSGEDPSPGVVVIRSNEAVDPADQAEDASTEDLATTDISDVTAEPSLHSDGDADHGKGFEEAPVAESSPEEAKTSYGTGGLAAAATAAVAGTGLAAMAKKLTGEAERAEDAYDDLRSSAIETSDDLSDQVDDGVADLGSRVAHAAEEAEAEVSQTLTDDAEDLTETTEEALDSVSSFVGEPQTVDPSTPIDAVPGSQPVPEDSAALNIFAAPAATTSEASPQPIEYGVDGAPQQDDQPEPETFAEQPVVVSEAPNIFAAPATEADAVSTAAVSASDDFAESAVSAVQDVAEDIATDASEEIQNLEPAMADTATPIEEAADTAETVNIFAASAPLAADVPNDADEPIPFEVKSDIGSARYEESVPVAEEVPAEPAEMVTENVVDAPAAPRTFNIFAPPTPEPSPLEDVSVAPEQPVSAVQILSETEIASPTMPEAVGDAPVGTTADVLEQQQAEAPSINIFAAEPDIEQPTPNPVGPVHPPMTEAVPDTTETVVKQDKPADTGGTFSALLKRVQGSSLMGAPGENDQVQAEPPTVDTQISATDLAQRSGANQVSDLLASSAAWLTLVREKPRFTRREVMEIFDTLPGDHPKTLEARIKGFGKLVRSGTLILIDDGVFAMAQTERDRYQQQM